MKDPSPQVRDAGVRALCNWPDASVAPELLAIAQQSPQQSHRIWALRAYARVAALPAQRPPEETFQMLHQAMALAWRTEDKQLILSRLSAVRTPETLEMALSFTDDKTLQPETLQTAAALAEVLSSVGQAVPHPPIGTPARMPTSGRGALEYASRTAPPWPAQSTPRPLAVAIPTV